MEGCRRGAHGACMRHCLLWAACRHAGTVVRCCGFMLSSGALTGWGFLGCAWVLLDPCALTGSGLDAYVSQEARVLQKASAAGEMPSCFNEAMQCSAVHPLCTFVVSPLSGKINLSRQITVSS